MTKATSAPAAPPPSIVLPTEKSPPSLSIDTAKVLLHGYPKVGKSTLVHELNPDHTLFLAADPGLDALDVFQMPIGSWADFRAVGPLLKQGGHPFQIVAIDTVDMLAQLCGDQVCADLGIKHPSDLEYGKGWRAVSDEFRLRISALCSLGLGVWFVSHSKDVEIKTRVGTKTKVVPSIGGGIRDFLVGFVDVILHAAVAGDEDGEQRVLYTQPTENIEAGQRVPRNKPPLPDVLPLDAGALRAAFDEAWGPIEDAAVDPASGSAEDASGPEEAKAA